MHEWALAEAVLDSVRAHSGGRRVSRVVLRFGELQQIDREIFDFALRELGGELGAALFEIESEPARFACNACSAAWSLDERGGLDERQKEAIHFLPEAAKVYLRCPKCGSADFRVEQGRGVTIQTIETIETEEGRAPGAGP
jgi:hydrogenase nickel incorporation protein HypA/HybF